MKHDFDIAIIGAGSGGLTVAFGLAAVGKKVALIEKGPIGGDCTNFGCVPSKALIDLAKHKPDLGLLQGLEEVRKRRKIIQDEETPEKIEKHGIKVFQGTANFIDEYHVMISSSEQSGENQSISAKYIVIASGSTAQKVDIPGVDSGNILTNHEIFEQTTDMKNIAVVGGGYIGCELAESLASFGVNVHVIQRNAHLIPREEHESSKLLEEIFQEKGINIHTNSHIISAKGGKLLLEHNTKKTQTEIKYDKVLLALGRRPQLEGLHLEKADIIHDKTGIKTNRYNQTNKKHIFAIGDCVSGNPQFTHWANHEGRTLVRNILFPYVKSSSRGAVLPSVLYTHLEIARVGKTHHELKSIYAEDEIITKTLPFTSNDRSKVTDDEKGFVIIHVKRLSGKILGATIFGKNAGEMIGQFTHAMQHKLSAYKLASTIQAYPTKSDIIKRVCDQFTLHTLGNIKSEIRYFFVSNAIQIATAIIWLSIISLFIWYKSSTGQSLEQMALAFYNFTGTSSIGAIIYIFAYAIRPIVLFPATLMTFMSGAIFGFVGGFIFTLIGETMSAMFAYFLGNVFGKKLLTGEDSGIIGQLKTQLNKDPFISVLTARFLFFPFDLTNYACGFLRVKFWHYTLATAIGIIPGMSVFILAGAAFHNKELTSLSDALKDIDTSMLLYAAGLFVLTLVFAKILKKVTNKSKK